MSQSPVVVTRDKSVTTIALNRPERLNALSEDMLDSVLDALHEAAADDEVRVVVLTGTGRAFSAGVDIKMFREEEAVDGTFAGFFELRANQIPGVITSMPKVVIAKINGACFTGALELALCCDLLVAAEDAKIGDTHAKFGVVPRWGMSQRLPRRTGMLKARELSYTAKVISGAEAARLGLVNEAVPADRLDETVAEMCRSIVANSPQLIAAYKELHRIAEDKPLSEGLQLEFDSKFKIDDTQQRLEGFAKEEK